MQLKILVISLLESSLTTKESRLFVKSPLECCSIKFDDIFRAIYLNILFSKIIIIW